MPWLLPLCVIAANIAELGVIEALSLICKNVIHDHSGAKQSLTGNRPSGLYF